MKILGQRVPSAKSGRCRLPVHCVVESRRLLITLAISVIQQL